jgi:hypothetical protein
LAERSTAIKRVISMKKTVAIWLMLGVFTLQTTGALWFAHLAEYSEPETAATCQCGHCHNADAHAFACGDIRTIRYHPASPGKPVPHRHDPHKCGICQFQLTLAATTHVPPALAAINEVAFEQPAPSDRPTAHTFGSTRDARGPPASTL